MSVKREHHPPDNCSKSQGTIQWDSAYIVLLHFQVHQELLAMIKALLQPKFPVLSPLTELKFSLNLLHVTSIKIWQEKSIPRNYLQLRWNFLPTLNSQADKVFKKRKRKTEKGDNV